MSSSNLTVDDLIRQQAEKHDPRDKKQVTTDKRDSSLDPAFLALVRTGRVRLGNIELENYE